MSLQRRLLLYLLLSAPLVWGLASLVSADRASSEVNELFDTEMIQLARQVQATLASLQPSPLPLPQRQTQTQTQAQSPAQAQDNADEAPPPLPTGPVTRRLELGDADVADLALAVWNAQGQLLLVDREGVQLPHRPQADGFVDLMLKNEPWRVFYLQSADGQWLTATGQRMRERDEVVKELVGSQLLPWLLVLPVLLLAMAWALSRALAPLRQLAQELQRRGAEDLRPLTTLRTPTELRPVLAAVNSLFTRIDTVLVRERRFTADAAHELRTPLAVLRAQWDVQRHAATPAERQQAEDRLGAGLDRLDRLVSQMLALARVDALEHLTSTEAVAWPAVVETAMNDVLPLAERRRVELACDWPAAGAAPFALRGDASLLGVLLRNLLDNAVRYTPECSTVTLAFSADSLTVTNEGPPLSTEASARLGERFHRESGQQEGGSGLGVSIAQRVAQLHGLHLHYRNGADSRGVVAELSRPAGDEGLP